MAFDHAAESQDEQRSLLLPEHGSGQSELAAFGQAHAQTVDLSRAAQRGDEPLRRVVAAVDETERKHRSHEFAGNLGKQRVGRRVGFEDLLAGAVDDQHPFGRTLEQMAVARLGIAKAPVLVQRFLLRIDEALLHGGHGPQIASVDDRMTGNALALVVDLERAVRQRQIVADIRWVIDLTPAWVQGHFGVAQQGFDLGPAFFGDGLDPELPDPAVVAQVLQAVAAESHV